MRMILVWNTRLSSRVFVLGSISWAFAETKQRRAQSCIQTFLKKLVYKISTEKVNNNAWPYVTL